MDSFFHINQGQRLLEKKENQSVRKALEHFKTANEMTEDGDIGKPQALYFLSLGNIFVGNLRNSYLIALKAKRAIPLARERSIVAMNSWPGEDKIDGIIQHLEKKYPQLLQIKQETEIDENELDFSNVDLLYPKSPNEKEDFSFIDLKDLDEETHFAVFSGMGRDHDALVYFDRIAGDVLSYVEGYFSSFFGDQSEAGRILVDKITSHAPTDYIDENRYMLIPRLGLTDFLNEFKNAVKGEPLFIRFINTFSKNILDDFEGNEDVKSTDDLVFSDSMREKFMNLFESEVVSNNPNSATLFERYFGETSIAISSKWIKSILA